MPYFFSRNINLRASMSFIFQHKKIKKKNTNYIYTRYPIVDVGTKRQILKKKKSVQSFQYTHLISQTCYEGKIFKIFSYLKILHVSCHKLSQNHVTKILCPILAVTIFCTYDLHSTLILLRLRTRITLHALTAAWQQSNGNSAA